MLLFFCYPHALHIGFVTHTYWHIHTPWATHIAELVATIYECCPAHSRRRAYILLHMRAFSIRYVRLVYAMCIPCSTISTAYMHYAKYFEYLRLFSSGLKLCAFAYSQRKQPHTAKGIFISFVETATIVDWRRHIICVSSPLNLYLVCLLLVAFPNSNTRRIQTYSVYNYCYLMLTKKKCIMHTLPCLCTLRHGKIWNCSQKSIKCLNKTKITQNARHQFINSIRPPVHHLSVSILVHKQTHI